MKVKIIAGTSYKLSENDNNYRLVFNSQDQISVALPVSLSIGFSVTIIQVGIGNVTINPLTGVMLRNYLGAPFRTYTQYARVVLEAVGPDQFVLSGDVPTKDITSS